MEGEVVSGIVRGLTGEAAKLFIHEANELLNPWPELKKSILLCKKRLPPPSVSVKSTTAVSPVVGKKILHMELHVEVDDAWEVQQASASTMASAPPVMIQYAAAHLLVSAVLAVLWSKISELRKKSKEEKKKKKKESDGGSGTGTGAGPIPTD